MKKTNILKPAIIFSVLYMISSLITIFVTLNSKGTFEGLSFAWQVLKYLEFSAHRIISGVLFTAGLVIAKKKAFIPYFVVCAIAPLTSLVPSLINGDPEGTSPIKLIASYIGSTLDVAALFLLIYALFTGCELAAEAGGGMKKNKYFKLSLLSMIGSALIPTALTFFAMTSEGSGMDLIMGAFVFIVSFLVNILFYTLGCLLVKKSLFTVHYILSIIACCSTTISGLLIPELRMNGTPTIIAGNVDTMLLLITVLLILRAMFRLAETFNQTEIIEE